MQINQAQENSTIQPKNKTVYVVVSQTDSIVSKIIKIFTKEKYNHVAVSLNDSLEEMYSFARKYNYWPFRGAFVKESPSKGALLRFKNTEIAVVELPVTQAQYDGIKCKLETMYAERDKYHYNYTGLFYAFFHKKHSVKHHYYCSEFVRMLLEKVGVISADFFSETVHPMEFLSLPDGKITYQGKLKNYKKPQRQEEQQSVVMDDLGVLV